MITSLLIRLFSTFVGEDIYGNKYYTLRDKRFVIYNGTIEPTKVPEIWHGWLHYMIDELPWQNTKNSSRFKEISSRYYSRKNHVPNLTGTSYSYLPKRKKVSSDYLPWKPNQRYH
ncbi:MAG: NADH-ubiquinone oxidoreductase subunit NDUFA12 family protein [Rickettsiaceae bacterium]|nr:NADH-ubiquinone oxidoreductase subunit NDUFA12 family protein [Rickettsiaceae bacterium]